MLDASKTEVFVYRVWKLRAALVVLAVAGVLGGWQLYLIGHRHADADIAALSVERERLRERLAEAEAQNAELVRRIARLERARQIDEQAYAEFRAERAKLGAELQELREELSFYRGIMSPAEARVGLQVQGFQAEPAGEGGRYQVRMVIVQVRRNDRVARGNLKIEVEGRQGGRPRTLPLEKVSVAGRKAVKYRFRYFQPVEDEWRFPDGFQPERVNVKAFPAGRRDKPLEWTFGWPETEENSHVEQQAAQDEDGITD